MNDIRETGTECVDGSILVSRANNSNVAQSYDCRSDPTRFDVIPAS